MMRVSLFSQAKSYFRIANVKYFEMRYHCPRGRNDTSVSPTWKPLTLVCRKKKPVLFTRVSEEWWTIVTFLDSGPKEGDGLRRTFYVEKKFSFRRQKGVFDDGNFLPLCSRFAVDQHTLLKTSMEWSKSIERSVYGKKSNDLFLFDAFLTWPEILYMKSSHLRRKKNEIRLSEVAMILFNEFRDTRSSVMLWYSRPPI